MYGYDAKGRKTSVRDANGNSTVMEYDALDRLIATTDAERYVTQAIYDAVGNLIQAIDANGNPISYAYDQRDRQIRSVNALGDTTSYSYDGVGNRLSVTEEDYGTTTYEYDRKYQLTGVTYPERDGQVVLPQQPKNKGTDQGNGKKNEHHKAAEDAKPSFETFVYDPAGNRVSKTDDWQSVLSSYNAANQLLQAGATTFTYDANGNRISKNEDGQTEKYYYNSDNFLVQVDKPRRESIGYGYDALNRRIYKANQHGETTGYLYDGLEVLQEVSGHNGHKVVGYYRANGRILTRQEYHAPPPAPHGVFRHRPEGRQLFYTYDALGSVATLTRHFGNLSSRYRYDAYGTIVEGDLMENEYGFTGRRFDAETGLYQFHFRMYDPMNGVWTAPDPIGIVGGVNLYSYVRNNPVNLYDLLGLEVEGEYSAECYSGSEEENADHHNENLGNYGGNDEEKGLRETAWGKTFLTQLEYQSIWASYLTRSVPTLSASYAAMAGFAAALNSALYSDDPFRDSVQTAVTSFIGSGKAILDFALGEAVKLGNSLLDEKDTKNCQ